LSNQKSPLLGRLQLFISIMLSPIYSGITEIGTSSIVGNCPLLLASWLKIPMCLMKTSVVVLGLRERPRRQVHVKFNNWELEGEDGSWFDLHQTDAPHDGGADWW
jgi:uncharacterized membrane-anchored protein YitT (DUF2179 family)